MNAESLKIGSLIDGEQQRDAIHVAIAPVVAVEALRPGQHVGFQEGSTTNVCASQNPVGIVDPFLTQQVRKGQWCWLFLYPGSITSLRHDWTHPAFGPASRPQKERSETWLREFAERAGLTFDRVMDIGHKAAEAGGCHVGDDDASEAFNNNREEFWLHFTAITGIVPVDRECYFSCAC